MNAYNELRVALKEVRLARGLGLRQTARELGLAPTTIWRIEAGKMEPSYTLLRRLCTFYGLNVTLEAEGGGLTAWYTERGEDLARAAA